MSCTAGLLWLWQSTCIEACHEPQAFCLGRFEAPSCRAAATPKYPTRPQVMHDSRHDACRFHVGQLQWPPVVAVCTCPGPAEGLAQLRPALTAFAIRLLRCCTMGPRPQPPCLNTVNARHRWCYLYAYTHTGSTMQPQRWVAQRLSAPALPHALPLAARRRRGREDGHQRLGRGHGREHRLLRLQLLAPELGSQHSTVAGTARST